MQNIQEKMLVGARAVFYARVSTEEEKQVNALEKQIQENRDVITSKGWVLVDEYIDEGKTGTMIKRRNEYQRLLGDIEGDKFDIIVIKDQERLMRNVRDWHNFLHTMVQAHKHLYIYLEGKFYSTDDALITGIKAIIAEEYSRNLSKKLNNANKRRIERALNGGELSAMGNGKSLVYKIEDGRWVKVPEEEKLGKKIFELYLEMDSIRKVRDWVNEHGYTNSVGKPFTSESISRILKNEKAKGVIVLGRYHHDFEEKKIVKRTEEEIYRISAPELAYVSEETFDEVQRRLTAKSVYGKNGKGRGKSIGRDPLSGKLYCGKCGKVLWKRQSSHKDRNGEKRTYYHWSCASKYAKGDIACTGVSTTTYKIREVYAELAKEFTVNKKLIRKEMEEWLHGLKQTLSDTTVNDALEKDIRKLESKKAKLLDIYLEGMLDKESYSKKLTVLDTDIEEKKKLLVPLEENEDIKEIEHTLSHLDEEVDQYVNNAEFEDKKIDWLIDHSKCIKVLESGDIAIELEIIAGAIIAGKNFMLFVPNTLPLANG